MCYRNQNRRSLRRTNLVNNGMINVGRKVWIITRKITFFLERERRVHTYIHTHIHYAHTQTYSPDKYKVPNIRQ